MDAYVITLLGNDYSERCAQRCIDSANIMVTPFWAIDRTKSLDILAKEGLEWTWGNGYRGLHHKSYGGDHAARVGCFLSHYFLWQRCSEMAHPMLILEHDAVFVRPFEPFGFDSICQINDPRGSTPRAEWWRGRMIARGNGVWPKTKVLYDDRPDGLAGNSAYVIRPHAARELLDVIDEVGAWPNDALICRQLVDGLQEVYPFITEVRAERSTIHDVR